MIQIKFEWMAGLYKAESSEADCLDVYTNQHES